MYIKEIYSIKWGYLKNIWYLDTYLSQTLKFFSPYFKENVTY